MTSLSKKIASLASFLMELVVYAGFVGAYFFLVLHYLGDWINHIFVTNKTHYAFLAVGLIAAQGVVLERLTSILLWVIRCLQAILPVLHRMARPHETISRPPHVPELLVYRFASPLFYFNAAYFAHRVQDVIDAADPPVKFFLVNAEAIADMDINAVEILEELHLYLKRRNIVLGLCEVKGDFRKVLMSTRLPHRSGFKIYPSVAVAVQKLSKERAAK